MIERITRSEYNDLSGKLELSDNEVSIADLGNRRYYKLTNATKQEMNTLLAEWKDTKYGAELPSYPPKKGQQ